MGGSEMKKTILPEARPIDNKQKLAVTNQKRYAFQMELGKGGGGEVELVLDKDIRRMVAIKKLHKDLHKPDSLLQFVNEIRMVGMLEHPNIVPIHDVGIDENNRYYFVMKYISGDTLKDVITKLKTGDKKYHQIYTFQQRVEIFTEILKAVDFAHQKGIIHRDLKPENISLGQFGEVTVMDWGIAKSVNLQKSNFITKKQPADQRRTSKSRDDGKTRIFTYSEDSNQKITIGTPLYMAPEQINQDPHIHDQRIDIYSLCTLFYEFLTLKTYIEPGQTVYQTLQKVLTHQPKLPMMVRNKFQPPVPADLSHFVVKGLKKSPEERYQTVKEMQNLLHQLAQGYTPIQCPFTFSKRLINSIIHLVNRYPMTGVMVFMMILIFIILGLYFGIRMII